MECHLISNFNSVLLLGWEFCVEFVRHGSTFLAIVTSSYSNSQITITIHISLVIKSGGSNLNREIGRVGTFGLN